MYFPKTLQRFQVLSSKDNLKRSIYRQKHSWRKVFGKFHGLGNIANDAMFQGLLFWYKIVVILFDGVISFYFLYAQFSMYKISYYQSNHELPPFIHCYSNIYCLIAMEKRANIEQNDCFLSAFRHMVHAITHNLTECKIDNLYE